MASLPSLPAPDAGGEPEGRGNPSKSLRGEAVAISALQDNVREYEQKFGKIKVAEV
ncbi:hypothetical protein [Candidatus Oleimmundimicrobium sp.]|uniref:hypothetical protein n=1 Tax=Candidatus Oleimmundimicrobium sp. TaxID=3060597 RepID=UPI002715F471|nr:hypothetical protein [Candidatus Oleimmundimicrobium sp.]MDO8886729.1 hypothetical protein [Candidatus Oleimmundimicrobium sp.]